MSELIININHESEIPKYQQVVNAINNAISKGVLKQGNVLPSVNNICKVNSLSRDTVFKSYSILKEQGVIESVPNKGYYVANETKKILLVLDTFKAYKEVLYHSFIKNLPPNIITDVQFHHYNIDNFKNIINNSIGKYYKYVVMNFDDKSISSILSQISNTKLLLIDWNINSDAKNNCVFQDFGKAFYEGITQAKPFLDKYDETIFVYPDYTNHPYETIEYFQLFCKDNNIKHRVLKDVTHFKIEKNKVYISVSDRFLGLILEQCSDKKFELGKDIGLLSYNETPMKKFIYKGISVISTDFKEMGTKAAKFISQDKDTTLQHYIKTKLTIRESL